MPRMPFMCRMLGRNEAAKIQWKTWRYLLPRPYAAGTGRKKVVILGSGWGAISFVKAMAKDSPYDVVGPGRYCLPCRVVQTQLKPSFMSEKSLP